MKLEHNYFFSLALGRVKLRRRERSNTARKKRLFPVHRAARVMASREADKFGFLFKLFLYLQRNDIKIRVKKILIIWKKKYHSGF